MPQDSVAKSKRPAHLPHGRWLGDFYPLSAFERKLVKACARGAVCNPDNWDARRPEAEAATEANTIRAEIIRFLALGGDGKHPVHEVGVMLRGAWIKDILSLHQATATVRLDLRFCHFENAIGLWAASLPELILSGSKAPGIYADRMNVKGGVFLSDGFDVSGEVRLLGTLIGANLECMNGKFNRLDEATLSADGMVVNGSVFLGDGFESRGEVRLIGARIGGSLDCVNGKFNNPRGAALNADRMVVHGSVFLGDGFEASGEIGMTGAQIDGNLHCGKAKFNDPNGRALCADRMVVKGNVFLNGGFAASGVVRFVGAQIGGSLDCENGTFSNPKGSALNADRIVVTGGVLLRGATIEGAVSLPAARIGTLADDVTCWQTGGHIIDGLHYDRIIGPTDAAMRIQWLMVQRKAHLTSDFKPQPWEQLIKTLREMGHPYDAAQVAIAKQRQLRKAGKIEGPARKTLHWLYGFLADYGYQPFKLVQWMTCLWLACAFFFSIGGSYGYIGPGTPLLNNPELAASIDENCGHRREEPKQVWTKCAAMPAEFTTFQPLLYSLDLILPLVDLQQDSDWAPIVEEAPGINMGYGVFLRWLMWFEILFGWVASLMLVAILGRLVEKD